MKKIALHWQILAALILSVVYGVYFHTQYTLGEAAMKNMEKNKISAEVMNALIPISNKTYQTQKEFVQDAQTVLTEKQWNDNKKVILKSAYDNPAISYVNWMGIIFMRALKMLIIPLILSSIISGMTNIGSGDSLGRLGLKTISYYVFTSFFAIITGLVMVNIFKPGIGVDTNFVESADEFIKTQNDFGQTLIEIIPTNVVTSMANGDMLSVIFFAVVFGFFITRIGNKPQMHLKDFFNSIFDVMMKMTMWIIRFTPLGVFGIVAKTVADVDDLGQLASSMGKYMLTVILALAFHAIITLPFVLKFIAKVSPLKHFKAVTTPLLTAFSTSSSGATLPLTMNHVEKKAGVSNKITSFSLPLGATINMDGTALYECIGAIFIAQAYGIDLSITQQILIVVTALLTSIGAAAIPMAGFVMISVILSTVGLPLEGVGLILAVDRILDMFRTSVNVWSDTCGAVTIAKSEGETLKV
jgi:proton glutamate symport protein